MKEFEVLNIQGVQEEGNIGMNKFIKTFRESIRNDEERTIKAVMDSKISLENMRGIRKKYEMSDYDII